MSTHLDPSTFGDHHIIVLEIHNVYIPFNNIHGNSQVILSVSESLHKYIVMLQSSLFNEAQWHLLKQSDHMDGLLVITLSKPW